ncbi:MAG: tRNA dihydrouridine(20/20a) synthase DusA [Hyphomicrobiales bacterium]|nr:tRNA dihydrouridine(20/20a) synthase DusA [Hyphomicrobiales bacterium]
MIKNNDKLFAVAPMMEWTDRHCRFFHRQLTRRALLYTEMVTAGAVIHGDRERLLGFSPEEHPVALQLGGSDPRQLAEAARIGADFGYDEINLNCGCPSPRVQTGAFGACLMTEPERVADCVAAMRAAQSAPVTVKCRIGVDDQDGEETLDRFADAVSRAGCAVFIVHARKAWLNGLSPKENREVPPLDYARVQRLKASRPGLAVILNGGLKTLDEAARESAALDGAMVGRAAYQNPEMLLGVDARFYGDARKAPSLDAACEAMVRYCEGVLRQGGKLSAVTRHMLGLFQGAPGARAYRRLLSEEAPRPGAGIDTLTRAFSLVSRTGDRLAPKAA